MTTAADQSMQAIADGVRAGTISPGAVVEEALQRIEQLEPAIRAWVRIDAQGARQAAEKVDQDVRSGRAGSLAGVLIGVKDIFDVAGLPTGAGFAPFADRSAVKDSAAVARSGRRARLSSARR